MDDLDDDLGEPLPILGAEPEGPKPWRPTVKLRRRERNKGVPIDQAPAVQAESIAVATGRGAVVDDEWRLLMRSGDRRKAGVALERARFTHNSDSGFGLA